ncbi:MAG: Crp/Fnr family transcriptional regulator [Tunicatimonas sp.]|uniref:Crp/Fnr family transcriptional regulator n=1 Tax=Tunicatimonas sp. TaxID=1940096 RepID=UPI003C763D92
MDALRAALEKIVSLSDDEWSTFQSLLKKEIIPKNSFLLQPIEICRATYYINQGLIRLYYVKDGEDKIRQFFFERSFFTDITSFLTQQPTKLYLQAIEDTELTTIPRDKLNQLYSSSPKFERMGRMIAEYTALGIANRMDSLFLYSPEERYLNLIRNRPRVSQRIPQYMVASYLGVTPEGLSRIKRRVADQERS